MDMERAMRSQEEGWEKENKTESLSAGTFFKAGLKRSPGDRSLADQLPNLTERPGRCRAKREVDLVSKAPRQAR